MSRPRLKDYPRRTASGGSCDSAPSTAPAETSFVRVSELSLSSNSLPETNIPVATFTEKRPTPSRCGATPGSAGASTAF
jgi:hypothetical protein